MILRTTTSVWDSIFCIEDIMFQIIYVLHRPNLNISHILASSFVSRSFDFLMRQNYYPNTTHITRVTSLESSDTTTLARQDLILWLPTMRWNTCHWTKPLGFDGLVLFQTSIIRYGIFSCPVYFSSFLFWDVQNDVLFGFSLFRDSEFIIVLK